MEEIIGFLMRFNFLKFVMFIGWRDDFKYKVVILWLGLELGVV